METSPKHVTREPHAPEHTVWLSANNEDFPSAGGGATVYVLARHILAPTVPNRQHQASLPRDQPGRAPRQQRADLSQLCGPHADPQGMRLRVRQSPRPVFWSCDWSGRGHVATFYPHLLEAERVKENMLSLSSCPTGMLGAQGLPETLVEAWKQLSWEHEANLSHRGCGWGLGRPGPAPSHPITVHLLALSILSPSQLL